MFDRFDNVFSLASMASKCVRVCVGSCYNHVCAIFRIKIEGRRENEKMIVFVAINFLPKRKRKYGADTLDVIRRTH